MTYSTTPMPARMVFDQDSYDDLSTQMDELNAEFKVREIEVTCTGERYFFGNVTSASDANYFIRDTILKGIEVQEHFVALYLNQANKIIGYYHHSTGTINSTSVDIEIVAAVALKTLAKAVIISHNHPSGNLKASNADVSITKRIKDALKLFDIALLDHIIVTKEGYFSFADHGDSSLSGLESETSELESKLRQEIFMQLKKLTAGNSPQLFAMIQSKQGYKHVEEMIIHKVMHDQMIPAAVIPQVEMELDMI